MYMYLSRTSSYRFIDSEESTMNDAYYEALAKVEILGRKEGIDEVFKREKNLIEVIIFSIFKI